MPSTPPAATPSATDPPALKYAKPKILLVDLPSSCSETLNSAGYNVYSGTFGVPYPVPRSNGLYPVANGSCNLPNHEEQEIVIASTACPTPADSAKADKLGEGVDQLWQTAKDGDIDPRPFFMRLARPDFDRIWESGGIFIVLVRAKYSIEYTYGPWSQYHGVSERERLHESSWGFLSELDSFNCRPASGREIDFDPRAKRLTDLLAKAATGAEYRCTIEPAYDNREHWIPLAKNKFGDCVAGLLVHDDPPRYLLLLPDMPHLDRIILRLLVEWCMQWNPALFPLHEGQRWVHRPEYEVPQILELKEQADKVNADAKARVEQIEAEIKELQASNKDWYTLLNGTGDELVAAVIRSLRQLGFKNVRDVDAEAREQGNGQSLREDIQIHDALPILIVDVKGVQGHPEDAEATQAEKHALMRAKEFSGNVKPLTIINHQRNIPPHDRDEQAYRQEIIDNAVQTGLGLMTTWDLFRLLRNKEKLGWDADNVIPIFYRTGRIEAVPEHYHEIGVVAKVWKDAIGIIPSADIHVGAVLALESGDTFEEITVGSLQVDGQETGVAPAGSNCGVACVGASKRFRERKRVWLVNRT